MRDTTLDTNGTTELARRNRQAAVRVQRILVVDDEPAVLTALQRALRGEGYDVTLAEDGRVALDRIADDPFDAIVLDVWMPVIDGLDVSRRLRARGDRTPVLMLTARDAISDRVAGLDAGADDYLVKPFALQELHARLRALLRRTDTSDTAAILACADLAMTLAPTRSDAATACSS